MVDDLSSRRYCSLFDLPVNGRYRFIEADILTADLASIFAGSTAVIHLAAITNLADCPSEGRMEEVNQAGTERVARACAKIGAPLVFVSTTSVYSAVAESVDETSTGRKLIPQNAYAKSKLEAERMLSVLAKSDGLRFVTCRFGTVFGPSPGMQFQTAINKFCWQAVWGVPITVWRTALHQRRPYLELGDAVNALLFILRTKPFDGEVFNVVTLNTTVSHVVQAISRHVAEASFDYVNAPCMNELSYDVDRRRFEGLGFAFGGSLDNGVAETVRMLGRAPVGGVVATACAWK